MSGGPHVLFYLDSLVEDLCVFVMFKVCLKLCYNLGLQHIDIDPKPESLLDFDVSQ